MSKKITNSLLADLIREWDAAHRGNPISSIMSDDELRDAAHHLQISFKRLKGYINSSKRGSVDTVSSRNPSDLERLDEKLQEYGERSS